LTASAAPGWIAKLHENSGPSGMTLSLKKLMTPMRTVSLDGVLSTKLKIRPLSAAVPAPMLGSMVQSGSSPIMMTRTCDGS